MKCSRHPWRTGKRRPRRKGFCLKCWFMRRFHRWITIEAVPRHRPEPVAPKP